MIDQQFVDNTHAELIRDGYVLCHSKAKFYTELLERLRHVTPSVCCMKNTGPHGNRQILFLPTRKSTVRALLNAELREFNRAVTRTKDALYTLENL